MKLDIVIPTALAAMLAAGSITGAAYASDRDVGQEATALQGARTTLAEAIATAEGQTGGQTYDAGVDTKGGQVRIVVETNGPKGVLTVSVDARSCQVVAMHEGGEED